MSENLGPVSDVYQPYNNAHHINDEPTTGHWGYTIAYELDNLGQPVPEGGNTAIFRIAPQGLTEPVFVTKPEDEATFTVDVLKGMGVFVRARADGTVDQITLKENSRVVVRPGEAYSYVNTGYEDLILHDVARPPFTSGDDKDITSSLIPSEKPNPRDGYAACVVDTNDGNRVIELPTAFFDVLSDYMK